MKTIYCIDTSSFLDAWRRSYHPDAFPSFWLKIDEAFDCGRLFSSEEVYKELGKKDDDLFNWAKSRKDMFLETEQEIWDVGTEIVGQFPKLLHNVKGRLNADAFVIAVAKLKGYTVVTEEDYGTATKPKIPLICDAIGVNHMSLLELVLTEKWRF